MDWYWHRNAARRHNPLMPMLLVIAAIMGCLLIEVITPTTAYASTTTATTDMYQLYDTRERTGQVSVNKVWDDGLSPEDREYESGKQLQDYADLLVITVQTGVPQAALRTYTITYDANGGTFGKDTNGNAITKNDVTYNTKNTPTNGTYVAPTRDDGYSFVGWSTDKTATTADMNITAADTFGVTDKWLNQIADGSTTTLYAIWKDIHINYAVMAYGIGVDKDANGNTMGITLGPALGYPEFSPYNGSGTDTSSTQTFTKSHSVSGDATIMSESAAACTDSSHSVITGTDAGTDAAGNAYRCLHYDNWVTIIYWNEHDPHVYDKCIPNHCSKTVTITPNAGTIANGIFSTSISNSSRGLTGDGQSYIMNSQWDQSYDVDIMKAGQGYAASLVRARLVGADAHTKLDDKYAGTDAIIKYTSESSILSCFPKNLHDAIGAKALSGVRTANNGIDVIGNDGVADRLWLFSYYEMWSTVYPSAGFRRSDYVVDPKRSSESSWWLRSPIDPARGDNGARYVGDMGGFDTEFPSVYNSYAVAPGFTLAGSDDDGIERDIG